MKPVGEEDSSLIQKLMVMEYLIWVPLGLRKEFGTLIYWFVALNLNPASYYPSLVFVRKKLTIGNVNAGLSEELDGQLADPRLPEKTYLPINEAK